MLRIAGAIVNFWLNSTSDPVFKKDKELQKLLKQNYKFAHKHGPLRFIRFRKGVLAHGDNN